MSTSPNAWAQRGQHEHNEVLCGPNCRFRPLYESTQRSLEEMSQNHSAALEVHGALRDGLISLAKRLFRGEVTEVEKGGHKLTDVDDEALLMYVEQFIADLAAKRKPDRGGLVSLRSALESKGFELPEGYDIASWVAALSAQGEDPAEGFPASKLLETRPLSDLDRELAALLAAEGLSAEFEAPAEPSARENTPQAPTQPEAPQPPQLEGDAGEAGGGLADLFSEHPAAAEEKTAESAAPQAPSSSEEDDLANLFDNPVDLGDLTDDLADDEVAAADLASDLEGDLEELFAEADATEEVDGLESMDTSEENPEELIEPETFDTPQTSEQPASEQAASEQAVAPEEAESEEEEAVPLDDLFSDLGEEAGIPGAEDAGGGIEAGNVDAEEAVDLSELFGDIDTIVPTSSEDLASLFGEPSETEPTPATADTPTPTAGSGGINPPKPQYLTPEQAAGTKLRPEVVHHEEPHHSRQKESKKPTERLVPREKAQRPERIRYDVPDIGGAEGGGALLNEELIAALAKAAEISRPVFMSDMAEVAGGRKVAEAWETEMRSVDNPPVRFLSARGHHRDRGSLVLPHRMRLQPTPEFSKSWWGQALAAGYRGNTLYELAVLISHLGDYIVSADMSDEVVVLRANFPQGLTGIVYVCGGSLENGGSTREALTAAVETLIGERLATVMVLAIRRGGENILADLLASEGAARSWTPAMPVAVDLAWKYATGRGSTAKLALGGS